MATIQNTARTLVGTVNPTSSDFEYTFEGTQVQIQVCTFWWNSTAGTLFICAANTGSAATWKGITLV